MGLAAEHMAFRCLNDDRRTIEIVTTSCLELTGYTPDELLIRPSGLIDLTDPADHEAVRYEIRRSLLQFVPLEVRYRLLTKDGTHLWVVERSRPAVAPDGMIAFTGFIEAFR